MVKDKRQSLVTFEMLTEFYHEMIKPQFDELKKVMNNGFDEVRSEFVNVKKEIEGIKSEIKFIKRDINDIKAELSDTPSRKEFNILKKEVKELSSV